MSSYLALRGLRRLGEDVRMVMPPLAAGSRLRGKDVPVALTGRAQLGKLAYLPRFRRTMLEGGQPDILHAQGIWLYHTYAVAALGRRLGIPYIISPRGMLYPQDIAKSNKLFKLLSLRLRLLADLNDAACIHATCREEMDYCRRLGVVVPIAVVPNPVEIRDYQCAKTDNIRRVCYLGRLSPRKNVEGLIRAFAALGDIASKAELLIVGGGDKDYEARLRSEAARLGLCNVRFAGFLSGREKDEALASADVVAMPSEFENLGNVVLEGLVRRKPCIATHGAPWQDLRDNDCGWWVEYSQDAITAAVREALTASNEQLQAMGDRGRTLVEESYSETSVALRLQQLYQWIVNGRIGDDKPAFVETGGVNKLFLIIAVAVQSSMAERRAA